MRRLVDDFSAFAKLPKVEPAPIDLGQVVEDFVRGHTAWQPHPALRQAGGAGRGAVRPHADPARARQPGRERHAGGRGRGPRAPRSCCASTAERGGDDDAAASTSSSTTTARACPRRRASASSIPTSRRRRTARGWAWRSCARSSSTTAATWSSRAEPSPLGGARFTVAIPAAAPAAAAAAGPATAAPAPARLRDPVGERGGGRGGEPRLDAPAAHAQRSTPCVVDGERGRVERLLAAVGERSKTAPSRRRGAARARRAACRRRRYRRSAARRAAARSVPSGSSGRASGRAPGAAPRAGPARPRE